MIPNTMIVITLLVCLTGFVSLSSSFPIPVPTPVQLQWTDFEIGAMISWGMETSASNVSDLGFCNFKTGDDGLWFAPIETYDPEFLDTDQWMENAVAFGAKYAVMTAKHCSGFALWPTNPKSFNYTYSVAYSPYKAGQVDVVRQFIQSCQKYGVRPGLYYGTNINFYLNILNFQVVNTSFIEGQHNVSLELYTNIVLEQLTELWTNYGDLTEIWFDGGEEISAMYNYLTKFQPNSIVFQGPIQYPNLIRWVGSEDGQAPYPCWSATSSEFLYDGEQNGTYFMPAETDCTIRSDDRWFWQDDYYQVGLKNATELYDNYELSVGRNTNFLLNLSPDPYGMIEPEDSLIYEQLGSMINTCYNNEIGSTRGINYTLLLDLGAPTKLNRIVIQEDLIFGQAVSEYSTFGKINSTSNWVLITNGTSIGHKRIERLDVDDVGHPEPEKWMDGYAGYWNFLGIGTPGYPGVYIRYLELVVTEAVHVPQILNFAVYNCPFVN